MIDEKFGCMCSDLKYAENKIEELTEQNDVLSDTVNMLSPLIMENNDIREKYSQAIQVIKSYIALRDGLDMAIMSMSKQIPLQPEAENKFHWVDIKCSECGEKLGVSNAAKDDLFEELRFFNFCYNCGQKMNWRYVYEKNG